MLLDLILAIGHHILVFGIAAILAAELVLIRPGINAAQLRQAGKIDLFYGIAAGLVVLVGFARVYFGVKGPDFYLQNPVFWAKIGTFAVVGLLSVPPTLLLLKWRGAEGGCDIFTHGSRSRGRQALPQDRGAPLHPDSDLRSRDGPGLRAPLERPEFKVPLCAAFLPKRLSFRSVCFRPFGSEACCCFWCRLLPAAYVWGSFR